MVEPVYGVEITVPLDIEAGVVQWLRSLGVEASTQVPARRVPGMVRVSRIGGELLKDNVRDQPTILVESWGKDQGDSWDRVQHLFGLFMYAGTYQAIPDIGVTRCQPVPPVTLEDYDAPELYRHQFTVDMTTQIGRITV